MQICRQVNTSFVKPFLNFSPDSISYQLNHEMSMPQYPIRCTSLFHPIRVEKILVRKSVPCYEVIWVIAVEEEKIQFSTYEYQCAINSAFPRLVETYHREERKRQRGLVEHERHRKFVGTSNSRHQSKQQHEKKILT